MIIPNSSSTLFCIDFSRQFRYVKHFFWFSEEPLTQESVDAYVKSEKAEVAHPNAAWAQETGKGVLFFAKRAEDKNTPSGIILLVSRTKQIIEQRH